VQRDPSSNRIPPGNGAEGRPSQLPSTGYGPGGAYAPPAGQPPPAWQPPPPPGAPPPAPPAPGSAPPPAGYPPAATGYPPPAATGYPPPADWPAPGPPRFGNYILATWLSRVAAALLDVLFILLAFVPSVALFSAHARVAGVILLLLALIWTYFLYAPVFMMRAGERNGQTPGKQILGIRVVRQDGEPMDFGWSLLRELIVKGLLIGVLGGFFLSLPILLDCLWPLWDEQNRALHDMIVSTRVVDV
jgi:uncharacterized RDD family membrane protein YckC